MDTALVRKWNLKDKLIKQFTPEENAEYNHRRYEKEKKSRLEYQKEYYQRNRERIKNKANERYKIKCGLRIENANN